MSTIPEQRPVGLGASNGPLLDAHDLLLVDLDGVAYVGDQPIPGAADALAAARHAGVRVVFVTNNAARPPAAVAGQLVSMGVEAGPEEVMTSAIAAADELARRLPAGTAVLVVGGAGVHEALVHAGLRPVRSASDHPAAVLQGFASEVGWASLAEATVAIAAGATWIATNADLTLPTPRGPLPGNGSLIAALAAATGQHPEVIGKPEPALFAAAIAAGSGVRPLVIGDRLDTDIAGARAAGLPSLLVLSGVSRAVDLLAAGPRFRPDHLGRDLAALLLSHPAATAHSGVATCGAIRAMSHEGSVRLERTGDATTATATADGLDGLRALCALAWHSFPASEAPSGSLRAYDDALATLDLD